MVDFLGGLLTAVGGAGAGGFKAAGEVADENIRRASDDLREQALYARQENLMRLNQQWQTEESNKNRTHQSEQTERGILATKAIHDESNTLNRDIHDQTDKRERELTSAKLASDEKMRSATMGQTAELRRQSFELQKQMLDQKADEVKSSKEYQRNKALMDSATRLESLQIDKDKLAQKETAGQAEAIPVLSEMLQKGDPAAPALAALHKIPLKLEKDKVVEKGFFFDTKKDVTSIDTEGLLKARSGNRQPMGQPSPELGSGGGQGAAPMNDLDRYLQKIENRPATQPKSSVATQPQSAELQSTHQPATANNSFNDSMAKRKPFGEDVGGLLSGLKGLSDKGQARVDVVNQINQDQNNYGLRNDGTKKGNGYLGPLEMKDGSGKAATEMSVGVNIDGKEMDIPILVPTLTRQEVDYLLKGGKPTDTIVEKAAQYAEQRIASGKSVWADESELNQ